MIVKLGGPFKVTDQMRTNIAEIFTSGRLSPGPAVAGFEKAFAAYHRVNQGVMTNSGTSALIVALQALKEIEEWPDGSEVICPAITFVATINAVLHCGLKPVLVDVRPETYTMDIDWLEDALLRSERLKAIIPVHVFGLSADMSPVLKLANYHDLKVVEDSCEALGATYNGGKVGGLGDIGCFSFYMSHHITAGVGGMAITGNPWYARKMRSLISHGWDRQTAPIDATEFDFEQIRQRYHFTSIGHSFRPTELEAAIAWPQLDDLAANIRRRVDNAKILTAGLSAFADRLQLPKCPYNRSHSLMMYPIVLREGNKWDLIKHLESNGIETREMLPLTNQPCYKGMFNEDDYPVAKWINKQGFYIGCSQYLTDAHMDYVVETFREHFE
jgi:dTDP-4-amino-4,6-dideoxygalactose transaminase